MTNLPFVSIIIPALNSEETIGMCLESIKSLNYPERRVEIIVVDNGSKDKTGKIAKEYGARVLHEPLIKIGAVRNCGVKVAHGDILAFTDSDCIVPEQWLMTAVEILEDDIVGAVGGGCLVPPDASWLEKAWVFQQKDTTKESIYLPGSNFILRKDIFNKLGGFDETMFAGEDDDFSKKLRKEGYILILHKSCFVIHLGYPKSLIGVAKRQIWHGKSVLENRESIFDKMLIFTHLYAISLSILPFAIITAPKSKVLLLITLCCIVCIPILSAGYKIYKYYGSGHSLSTILRFLYLIPIFLFFFIGRSVGLVYNYKDAIVKRWKVDSRKT